MGREESRKSCNKSRLHSTPGPHTFFHFRAEDHKQSLRSEPRRLITRHCFSGFLLTQRLAQRLAASTVSTTHGRRPPQTVSTYGCPGSEPAAHKLQGAEATKPAEPQRSDSYTSAPTEGGLEGLSFFFWWGLSDRGGGNWRFKPTAGNNIRKETIKRE